MTGMVYQVFYVGGPLNGLFQARPDAPGPTERMAQYVPVEYRPEAMLSTAALVHVYERVTLPQTKWQAHRRDPETYVLIYAGEEYK